MIREIVNFMRDLLEDCPDIMKWNLKPNGGLYIFVDIDSEGKWLNENGVYGKDYVYVNANADDSGCSISIDSVTDFEEEVKRVGTSMHKTLDGGAYKIFSCSPFAVVFKKKSWSEGNIDGKLLSTYFGNAKKYCSLEDQPVVLDFERICLEILPNLERFVEEKPDGKSVVWVDCLKNDEYISIYLRSTSLESYKEAHDNYLSDKLFNTHIYDKTINGITYGLSGFLNGLNNKKPFLPHRTAALDGGISGRISFEDAIALDRFQSLISRKIKVLPNPLPIAVNDREVNKLFFTLFHGNETALSYREMIKELFEQHEIEQLSDFYLLNYFKEKAIVINDIDFVPMFRYYFERPVRIENVMQVGNKQNNVFIAENDILLKNVFDFERIVVKEIFNNCLVTIKKDGSYISHYFGEINNANDVMHSLVMKYRMAFYEYVYKSKWNAIDARMFDDMMFASILANIKNDEVKAHFSNNFVIKTKLNIWFSLYNMFNNKNKEIMASNVTALLSKMRTVAKRESVLDSPEEFAFAAGQLVSYLIDQSEASNKSYAMLEPYLQKTKSAHLQDAIAHSFSQYKHAISVYNGAFKSLASNVMSYDGDVDMKPLLKYFLAGCFSGCVIYDKKENNE